MRRLASNNPSTPSQTQKQEVFDVEKGFGALLSKLDFIQNQMMQQSAELSKHSDVILVLQKNISRVSSKAHDSNLDLQVSSESPGTDREFQTPEERALDDKWIHSPLAEPFASNITDVDSMCKIADECGAKFIQSIRNL